VMHASFRIEPSSRKFKVKTVAVGASRASMAATTTPRAVRGSVDLSVVLGLKVLDG